MKQNSTGSHSARATSRKGNQQTRTKSTIPLSRPLIVIILLTVFGLAIAFSSSNFQLASAALQTKGGGDQISESAARQIQALLDEKESRTPALQKIDSQLIYALKTSRGQAIANGVPTLQTSVVVDSDRSTVVDITVNNLKIAYSKLTQLQVENSERRGQQHTRARQDGRS